MEPAKDTWYCNRGRRAKQIDQPPQASIGSKYLGYGDYKIECVSQWTLEKCQCPWSSEINSIAELSKPQKQNPRSMFHTGNPGMTSGGSSPSPGAEAVRRLGACSPFPLLLPQIQEKEQRKCGNNALIHFPLIFNASQSNQLCKHYKK